MKKSISISGILCANLMMFGSMFKVMHWPGTNVMLIFAVLLFCFVFLPMALVNNYKRQEEDKKYFALHVTTLFVFFIGIMGVLFKIMHWPSANIQFTLGMGLLIVFFLPIFFWEIYSKEIQTPEALLSLNDQMNFNAINRHLLTIGEEVKKIEIDLLNTQPQFQWHEMRGIISLH